MILDTILNNFFTQSFELLNFKLIRKNNFFAENQVSKSLCKQAPTSHELLFILSFRLSSQSSSQRLASASNAGYGISNSDYAGSGVVSRVNDDDDYEDVQVVVTPAYIHSGSSSSRLSSSNAYEADEMQQRVVPGDLSSVSSSAYRATVADQDDEDVQRTVGSGYVGQGGLGYGSSRVYSQSRGSGSELSRTGSVAVPVYVAGQRRVASSASQSESEINESRKPIPTGQYVSFAARPGQSTVLAVPVRVLNVQGTAEDQQKYYSRSSDHSSGSDSTVTRVLPASQTYRVIYNPTYISSADRVALNSESESTRVGGVQQPEKFTNYNSFNALDSASQVRSRTEENDSDLTQTRIAPVSVTYPQNGGSSRYASSGSTATQQGTVQSRVVPAFPVHRVESSLSSRTAEEREQRRYTPAVPTYISSSNRQSASELEESRNQQSLAHGGTYYAPSTSQTRIQTQHQAAGAGAQTQYQRQGFAGNFSPYVPSRSQTSSSHLAAGQSADRLSTRFGTGVLDSNTDDLHSYISESERLARLQQQQIAGASSGSAVSTSDANRRTMQTASSLDSAAANFVRTSNLANRNSELDTASFDNSGTGGYNKVRSWNKQSKWSSGN